MGVIMVPQKDTGFLFLHAMPLFCFKNSSWNFCMTMSESAIVVKLIHES
jgi:hypothetical protein